MAGNSKRFSDAGYKLPKFFLKIGKTTLIENVLNTYNDNDEFYLIFNNSQKRKYLEKILNLKKLKKKMNISFIEDHNKGPVFSIISANYKFYNSKVLIAYNDFLVDWDYKKFLRVAEGYDGSIVSFKGFHPSSYTGTLYCYLKSKNNLITNLREKKSFTKKPYAEPASVGIYYFDNFKLFLDNAERLNSKKNLLINNELYVSQIYLEYIKQKKNILDFNVNNFISLGTPREYELFLYWKEFFQNE